MNDNGFNDNFAYSGHESQVNLLAKAKLKPIELQKRFYKAVELQDGVILLDGKALKTPARNALVFSQPHIAQAMANEWAAQAERINPHEMPITKLVFTAIDAVAKQRAGVIDELLRYANTDLLIYHAHEPAGLLEMQNEAWAPVLAWAEANMELKFNTTQSVIYIEQPADTLEKLRAYFEAMDDLALTIHHTCTTLLGSNLLALAVREGFLNAEAAWAAAHVDESWNRLKWGEDEEDTQLRAKNYAVFEKVVGVCG